jgi:serine/threonine protein kinase
MNLAPGTRILDLIIGQKIGQGAFGEIYSAIHCDSGEPHAIKTEAVTARRKTLAFEYQILAQIQSSPYFARLGSIGRAESFTFFSMELLGPSLGSILKQFEPHKLSFSTSIRCCYHILRCIESFHRYGFVHRDIKPGNILIREGTEYPLCLIDFGLSRVFVNPETGQHLSQRRRVGFRGTRAYASRYAHMSHDLSRRDDLISWFYLTFELIVGPLPWRQCPDKAQILFYKDNFDIAARVDGVAPEMNDIWTHISALAFGDTPNYGYLYHHLMRIMQRRDIVMDAVFDWAEKLNEHRRGVRTSLEIIHERRRLGNVREMSTHPDGMSQPLLTPNITVPPPFSHISESEDCSCCRCC